MRTVPSWTGTSPSQSIMRTRPLCALCAASERARTLRPSCCLNSLLLVIYSNRKKETNKRVFQRRTDKDLIRARPPRRRFGCEKENRGQRSSAGSYECAFDFIKRRRTVGHLLSARPDVRPFRRGRSMRPCLGAGGAWWRDTEGP